MAIELFPDTHATRLLAQALGIALIEVGLLMGVIFREANQLNTWVSFLSFPVFGTALAVLFPLLDTAGRVLDFLPTSRAMRLAVNGMSGEEIFANPAPSFGVVVAWGAAAYIILLWTLQRRQA